MSSLGAVIDSDANDTVPVNCSCPAVAVAKRKDTWLLLAIRFAKMLAFPVVATKLASPSTSILKDRSPLMCAANPPESLLVASGKSCSMLKVVSVKSANGFPLARSRTVVPLIADIVYFFRFGGLVLKL